MNLFNNFTLKESLGFGSLISATDAVAIIASFKDISVDPGFFQILLGESVLNDAVSIVFYETTLTFQENSNVAFALLIALAHFSSILLFSILVGYSIGYVSAWAIKIMTKDSKSLEEIEIGCMVILPFVSYLISEMLGLSGIVSILFNGVAHSAYTKPYLKAFSKISIKSIYGVVTHLFESLAYIFIGIGFSSFSDLIRKMNFGTFIFMVLTVYMARAVNIIICSKLVNYTRTSSKLDLNKQVSILKNKIVYALVCWRKRSNGFCTSIKKYVGFPCFW